MTLLLNVVVTILIVSSLVMLGGIILIIGDMGRGFPDIKS